MWGFGKKGTGEPAVVNRNSDMASGWIGYGTGAAPALTHATALQTSAILCAVRVISEDCAKTPINLIETFTDGGLSRRRIKADHWAHKLLQKPNAFQTKFEFVEMMVANSVLGKGALAIKTRVGNEVRELLPVPSGSWVQETLTDTSYQFRVTFSDGSQYVFPQTDVLFFRGLSLDGYSGVSAIDNARKVVGIASGLESQTLNLATAGGRPSGIVSYESELTPERKTAFREAWRKQFGVGGEGGVALLDGTVKFDPIAMSAVDSQVIENRKFQITEIARIFRVHPSYLMETQTVPVEVQRYHVKNTLMPWFVRFEQALNRDLLGNVPNLAFDFDDAELLRGDHAAMGDFFQKALGNGGTPAFMSVNEVRYELGLDPHPEDWAKTPSRGGYAEAAGMKNDEVAK
ncbi:phage portal protein [Cereibacter changlensis]|uniref:phage portal protein n=1 Tax=Cereibacter changlensis TaxID=402884 RepID=UPI004034A7AB